MKNIKVTLIFLFCIFLFSCGGPTTLYEGTIYTPDYKLHLNEPYVEADVENIMFLSFPGVNQEDREIYEDIINRKPSMTVEEKKKLDPYILEIYDENDKLVFKDSVFIECFPIGRFFVNSPGIKFTIKKPGKYTCKGYTKYPSNREDYSDTLEITVHDKL